MIKDFFRKRKEKRLAKEEEERAAFRVEWEKAKAKLDREKELYGLYSEFTFVTKAECDAFIKGLNYALDKEKQVTKVVRTNEWWVKVYRK